MSHAENAIAQMKGIAYDAMSEARAARRRYAADLATHTLDCAAFDAAVEAFDAEYRKHYQPRAFYDQSDCEELHHDAQLSALEAFLKTYLTEAGT